MYVTTCSDQECRALVYRVGPGIEKFIQPEATPTPAADPSQAMAGLIPNNPALVKALKRVWHMSDTGQIEEDKPGDDRTGDFDRELLRSVLYVNTGPTAQKYPDKNLVHVNEKSVVAFDGPGSKATAATPTQVFAAALAQKKLVYVQYEEGDDGTSLFTALDEDRLKDLLARAKKGQ